MRGRLGLVPRQLSPHCCANTQRRTPPAPCGKRPLHRSQLLGIEAAYASAPSCPGSSGVHGLRLLLRLLGLPQLAADRPQAHPLFIPTGGLMLVHVCISCSLLLPPLWPGELHFLSLGVHSARQSQLADWVEMQPSLPMRGAQLLAPRWGNKGCSPSLAPEPPACSVCFPESDGSNPAVHVDVGVSFEVQTPKGHSRDAPHGRSVPAWRACIKRGLECGIQWLPPTQAAKAGLALACNAPQRCRLLSGRLWLLCSDAAVWPGLQAFVPHCRGIVLRFSFSQELLELR